MSDKIDKQILRELRIFDFCSQNLWPLIRPLFKGKINPRCPRCTISSAVPGVELVKEGGCNLCIDFDNRSDQSEDVWVEKYLTHQRKEFDEIVKSYEGKGRRRYDAVVLFSGGKDSTYMLDRLTREYPGLRILLMTWDNGFYSSLALENVKEIVKKLDLDHIVYKPKSSVYKSLYRYTLKNTGGKGCYQTVDRFDGSLNQFLGCHFAYEMDIPLVLAGVDFAQEMIMQHNTWFEWPKEDMATRVYVDRMERISGLKIADVFSEEDQKLFWDGTDKDKDRLPRYLVPLAVWRPDKGKVKHELAAKGLTPARDLSPVVTNNQVLTVMGAVDFQTIGYFGFEPEFAEMIRNRENELVYWKNLFEYWEFCLRNKTMRKMMTKKVLKKLGISLHDLGFAVHNAKGRMEDRKGGSSFALRAMEDNRVEEG
jgi:hypothetical protein